ncbi:dynein axonemal light chain 1 [Drosophila grimshawi]|uniref:Dynein axonemal light chain 1 n=1 Tax=Drosophila grimshawi TaxID=7222 RepID=B4JEC7_DROGR|nr:dynein axonemal light chain 1 [Drosophila grimshawi]EDW03647.1 GH10391 [Drosophila grimshawi]
MAKPTTIKDALARWEDRTKQEAISALDIGLQFQYPPIEKMDATLSNLVACQKLSLSSNMIEKISGISGMKNLRILSLARNYLKNLNGIEVLADTLEELWVSYNNIEKIKPIEAMKALKVFYISHNLVKDWAEFARIGVPPSLIDITFVGNPLNENMDTAVFIAEATRRLPNLKKLDGEPLIR